MGRSKKSKMSEDLAKRYKLQLENIISKDLSLDLRENVKDIQEILGDSSDVIVRVVEEAERPFALIFIDELVNKEIVFTNIMGPLLCKCDASQFDGSLQDAVQACEMKKLTDIRSAVDTILQGDTVLLIDQKPYGWMLGTKGWATRSVGEPSADSVVRGPREGFSDTLSISVALIRRRLKDPNLRIQSMTLGERSKTGINCMYLQDIADPAVIEEVNRRLSQIQIDGVLETGYIEELIQDQVWSPFPQLQSTERPDAVVAHLLEGKVAILVDGTPFAMVAPAVFTQFYNSAEDYYEHFLIATFLRFIRVISFFIALLFPALYVAVVTYHPEVIPSSLAVSIAAGRAFGPFSPIIEALVMELTVEILREASLRLPGPMAQTIGVVGAVVVGNAAVEAGLVSTALVIVTGFTAISTYANPSYSASFPVRLLRFAFMLTAAFLGLYGVLLGVILLCLHLVQLRSFGVPYMAPIAPLHWPDLKDTFIRVPWKWMGCRPVTYHTLDRRRMNRS